MQLMKKQKIIATILKRYFLMIVIILPTKIFLVKTLHNT